MANRWGIPKHVEELVKSRDLNCVYCGIPFSKSNNSFGSKPSWEHIINDIRLNTVDNVVLCCRSCNSSKGAKALDIWLDSSYCKSKGITIETVSKEVKVIFQRISEQKIH